MCELLGGALTGNGATKPDRRFSNGMLAIYIDPKVSIPSNFFDGEVARYIAYFKDSKPAEGHDAVLIPGEPEATMRADRTKNGVPLPDETWASIVNTAREVGVSEVSIQRVDSVSRAVIASAAKQSSLSCGPGSLRVRYAMTASWNNGRNGEWQTRSRKSGPPARLSSTHGLQFRRAFPRR